MPTGGSRFSQLRRELRSDKERRVGPTRTGTEPRMRREVILIIAFSLLVIVAGLSYAFFAI